MFRKLIHTGIIFFTLVLLTVLGDRVCEPLSLTDVTCSDKEFCDEPTKSCQCSKGYERFNETSCIPIAKTDVQSTPNYSSLIDNQGGGSVVAGILIPLFMVAFAVCGVYIIKKYHLVTWVRNKLNRRNENYDEFMIGQDLDDDDDPPLH